MSDEEQILVDLEWEDDVGIGDNNCERDENTDGAAING